MRQEQLNYYNWISRAESFISGLTRLGGRLDVSVKTKPPLTRSEVEQLEASLPYHLPHSLRRFLESGSSGCEFHYIWTPPDDLLSSVEESSMDLGDLYCDVVLCDASAMLGYWQSCQWGAEDSWPPDEPLWRSAVPFAAIINGDYLALDLSRGDHDNDPPVVYLSHDDESCRIASSFDSFLRSWERLCYIGPEIYVVNRFRSPRDGFLDADTAAAQQLRRILGVG